MRRTVTESGHLSMHDPIETKQVAIRRIEAMRDAYRREMNCQIVHDSYHERGFTDSYELIAGGRVVGYGSVAGRSDHRDVIKELFVLPDWRTLALPFLRSLIATSGATVIEAQTNDPLLSVLFWDVAGDVSSDTILFSDAFTTTLTSRAMLRRLTKADRARVFAHTREPIGDWGLEQDGEIVATGGLTYHYNEPYADIYMEVAETQRRRGLGSFLVQELKRIARDGNSTPAARCNTDNVPSRLTLQRAGMLPCGRILRGQIAT
jgi:GNAT superfamily N-acetyltransferase